MKWYLVLLVAVIVICALAPQAAGAENPQPYQFALVKCSSLSLSEVQSANQMFDTTYGYEHQLTTPAQWLGTYEARVNEFASSVGCPRVLDGGQLTFWYKIYAPTYQRILRNTPP